MKKIRKLTKEYLALVLWELYMALAAYLSSFALGSPSISTSIGASALVMLFMVFGATLEDIEDHLGRAYAKMAEFFMIMFIAALVLIGKNNYYLFFVQVMASLFAFFVGYAILETIDKK